MPIQAPPSVTGGAAGEFKDTTAAFRKTGPIEKYPPVSQRITGLMLNGLGPIAPRVDELTRDGKMVTTTSLRAAEIAAKIQRGDTALTPVEMAQAHIAVREALEAGLEDPNSPFYQKNATLRTQRGNELGRLEGELTDYLTQETKRPEDVTARRWRRPFRRRWQPFQLPRHTVPIETRSLTPAETTQAESQSRIVEDWDGVRARITTERHGARAFGSLTSEEQRLVSLATSEELSRKFDDGRVQEILDQVRQGVSRDSIEDALENGTDAEKRFANRVQKVEDNREELLRRAKDLSRVKRMAEFQRFLGVDDSTLSQTEIAEAIVQELGIFDEREINRLMSSPDRAFSRFFQEAGPLGTVTFVGKLFRGKLEKFAENRGVTPKPERVAGQPPENLSRDALIGLPSEALALQLVDNKLTTNPVEYLVSQGIDRTQAQAMLDEAVTNKQFTRRNPDGSYSLNHDKLGEWNDNDLAVLGIRGIINLNDATAVSDLRNKMDTALTATISDVGARNRELDRRITNIKDLAKINDAALPPAEQQRIIRNWDKRSLALLVLLLGPLFMTRIINGMATNEQRAFQNMLA